MFVLGTDITLSTDVHPFMFSRNTTSEKPTYIALSNSMPRGTILETSQLELDSSFIRIYTLHRKGIPDSLLGFAVSVVRGECVNLGVSLLIRSKKQAPPDKNYSVTLNSKLGFLRLLKVGNDGIFIGVNNGNQTFF